MGQERILIRHGLWSTVYREGDMFIKKYNYYLPDAVNRESKASKAAELAGIRTPHCRFIRKNDKSIESVFDFYELTPIHDISFLKHPDTFKEMQRMLNIMPDVKWKENDDYWNRLMLPDFLNALTYLNLDVSRYESMLRRLSCQQFIHGDFGIENIGISNNHLIVYDFQHGSWGPKNWDKAYLFASFIYNSDFELIMGKQEQELTAIISAIRLGRAIRKHSTLIKERKDIFISWKQR